MRKLLLAILLAAVAIVLVPSRAFTWGDTGHLAINRTAAEKVPADMPAFLKANPDYISYTGPEPDRWRSNLEEPLNRAQAPDHFIDMEYVDWMQKLPADRYAYIRAIYERRAQHPDQLEPEKIGFQPYITIEVFDRLKVAFREYRHAQKEGRSTANAEANALLYAGWLGHYVADGSNPLHTTKQYNGWVGDNPNGYTTEHTIHTKMETAFVNANPEVTKFADLVGAPKHLDHPFEDYIAYLRESQSKVEKVYQMDKACGFEGKGSPESREFIRQQLGRGAQMLLNMWYTA
ncbi:MAG TPA: hypothetical protein VMU24_10535, partial [Candidatus Acidoferrales bacterium]|nr:hypothetical protein [Candidatus Acidoferrales bacterium]